jgi:hypothetical protein
MAIQVVGFDLLKRDYPSCKDFSIIYADLMAGQHDGYLDFSLHDSYLFKSEALACQILLYVNKLFANCIQVGATGHFGGEILLAKLKERCG